MSMTKIANDPPEGQVSPESQVSKQAAEHGEGSDNQTAAVSDPAFDSLRKRGHRVTAQRETILQIFREQPHGEHLSAEELHAKLVGKGSNVSLATAYRTLKLLSSIGLLRELDFAEGHKHYELKQDTLPHQHIICTGCNMTLEFEDHFLEEAGQKIGKRYNFEVIDAQFKIFGQCPNCKLAKGAKK